MYLCSRHGIKLVLATITNNRGRVTEYYRCPVPGCNYMRPNKWQTKLIGCSQFRKTVDIGPSSVAWSYLRELIPQRPDYGKEHSKQRKETRTSKAPCATSGGKRQASGTKVHQQKEKKQK